MMVHVYHSYMVTYSNSCSYDILTNTDDGSCLYLDIFGICDGNNTIQMAIDSSNTGDIIYIPSGTYSESLVINKLSLIAKLEFYLIFLEILQEYQLRRTFLM